jgi:predicted dehydrogenase
MTAKTIDWPNWLGSGKSIEGKPIGPELQARPFDRTTFAQWRCDATFSGGPLTEWLYPTTVRFLAATGLQTPRRVMALGGLYQERDGRSIPDMVTITADYDEGCQLILTSTTLSNYPAEEVIRGRAGTLKFIKGGVQFFANESSLPARLEKSAAPQEVLVGNAPTNETQALWLDFLNKVRTRDRQTLCPPELGFSAVVLIEMATQSLHTGRVIVA